MGGELSADPSGVPPAAPAGGRGPLRGRATTPVAGGGPLDWAPIRGRLSAGPAPVVGGFAVAVVACVTLLVAAPDLDRLTLAGLAVAVVGTVALVHPRAGILLVVALLPFLALLRRLVIPLADWTPYDPLLVVAPILGVMLIVRGLLAGGRAARADAVAAAVAGLLALTVVEAFNPEAGSVVAGLSGLLFTAAPLLWFFVGMRAVDDRTLSAAYRVIAAAAVAVAVYGLVQSNVGFPQWDLLWTRINDPLAAGGYTALRVGSTIRPFGSLASAQEYNLLLAVGVVLALTLRGRIRIAGLAALPILAVALAQGSQRQAIVLAVAALLVVLALRARSARRAAAGLGALSAAVVVGVMALAPVLNDAAQSSGDELLQHQVQGITDPLNASSASSTLAVHAQLFASGVLSGFEHPLGLGTAAANIASSRAGSSTSVLPEVDLAGSFVGLGLAGGLLYLAIVVTTLYRVGALCLRRASPLAPACMALLVVMLGQWLNGGLYALAPLAWLSIGWANRTWLEASRRAEPAAEAPRPDRGRAAAARRSARAGAA